jgi:hypothetical protein
MAQQRVSNGGPRTRQGHGGNRYGGRSTGSGSNYRNSSRSNYQQGGGGSSYPQQHAAPVNDYDYDYLDYGSGYVGDYRYSAYTPTHDQQTGQQYYGSAAPLAPALAPAIAPRVTYPHYSIAPPLVPHRVQSFPPPSTSSTAPQPLSDEASASPSSSVIETTDASPGTMAESEDPRRTDPPRNVYPPQIYHPSYGSRGQATEQYPPPRMPHQPQAEYYPAAANTSAGPKPPVLSPMLHQHAVSVTSQAYYPAAPSPHDLAAMGYAPAPNWQPLSHQQAGPSEMYPSYLYPAPTQYAPSQYPTPGQYGEQYSGGSGGGGGYPSMHGAYQPHQPPSSGYGKSPYPPRPPYY